MIELLSSYHESPAALQSSFDELQSLASGEIQPNRQEVIEEHRNGFATQCLGI